LTYQNGGKASDVKENIDRFPETSLIEEGGLRVSLQRFFLEMLVVSLRSVTFQEVIFIKNKGRS